MLKSATKPNKSARIWRDPLKGACAVSDWLIIMQRLHLYEDDFCWKSLIDKPK
nr:MAG TPA: hypothetical protein [Caudoviricetes sp.]